MISFRTELHDSRIVQGHRCYSEALDLLDWDDFSSVFVLSQDVVWEFHGEALLAGLGANRGKVKHYLLPDGESIKNLTVFGQIHQWLADAKADRKSLLIVLGGGVVGDLVGFVAATYMRGIRWVYLPTTLLAQQDASVGGKVAVNLPQGKNLVGRFWHPEMVVIDTSVLATLPGREVNAGYMELLKHGMLAGPELYREIVAMPSEIERWQDHGALLWQGLQVKVGIVRDDPFEKNRRRLLNLGHTFGHALESAFEYKYWLHGEAVGVGLLFAAALAQTMDRESPWQDLLGAIAPRLPPLRLDAWERDRLLDLTRLDKKGVAGQIPWIIPHGPGEVDIVKGVDDAMLQTAYSGLMELLEGHL